MAVIKPFRGIRFNENVSGDLGSNICPPFDAITPELFSSLYERSPYNIVRLELAREEYSNRSYDQAATTLKDSILLNIKELKDIDPDKLINNRIKSYEKMGKWSEG